MDFLFYGILTLTLPRPAINLHKQNVKIMTTKIQSNQEEKIANLERFSDKDLLNELRDRGYFGEIRKPVAVKIAGEKSHFLSPGIKAI